MMSKSAKCKRHGKLTGLKGPKNSSVSGCHA